MEQDREDKSWSYPLNTVAGYVIVDSQRSLRLFSPHYDEKGKPVARFAKESSHPNIAPLPSDLKELQVPFFAESNRNIDLIYRKRREHLKYICSVEHLRSQTREKRTDQLWHYKSLNILYCPLENHDTVIWRKTFEIWMRSQSSTRSSFDLDWRQFSRSKYNFPTLKETELQTEAFMTLYNSSLKVIYTRDPHWQLFEYYVNNFVVPSNESLQLGKQITLNHKDSRTKEDLKCGHSVTFKEFTNYLRSTNQYSSFAGTANHCDVCGIDFDVIGKEDTFEQDTLYVYNKLKSPDKVSAFEDFQREYDFSIIEGFVETAFTRKNNITCISTYSMYLRLWRQLQIWGYISKNITFPYTKEESLTLTYTKLLDATLMAYHNSVPMSRSNRFEAIGQAYFDLTLGDLGSVRKPFELDFHLFSYPDRPALVYFKQGPRSDFTYLDIVAHRG
ncbi:carbohydrate sulfotransferase 11-like isoform X2 [Haliotis cracherodii]|uniref:carbohydrate sulfotransferase 11-like isoform X2 n=1 Tax=Haliotis cracherodii TaxID=6455 RepID=UPI0039EA358A